MLPLPHHVEVLTTGEGRGRQIKGQTCLEMPRNPKPWGSPSWLPKSDTRYASRKGGCHTPLQTHPRFLYFAADVGTVKIGFTPTPQYSGQPISFSHQKADQKLEEKVIVDFRRRHRHVVIFGLVISLIQPSFQSPVNSVNN